MTAIDGLTGDGLTGDGLPSTERPSGGLTNDRLTNDGLIGGGLAGDGLISDGLAGDMMAAPAVCLAGVRPSLGRSSVLPRPGNCREPTRAVGSGAPVRRAVAGPSWPRALVARHHG